MCPEKKLKIKVLDKFEGKFGYKKGLVFWRQVGVSGCGKQIRYINANENVGQWVANSTGK